MAYVGHVTSTTAFIVISMESNVVEAHPGVRRIFPSEMSAIQTWLCSEEHVGWNCWEQLSERTQHMQLRHEETQRNLLIIFYSFSPPLRNMLLLGDV